MVNIHTYQSFERQILVVGILVTVCGREGSGGSVTFGSKHSRGLTSPFLFEQITSVTHDQNTLPWGPKSPDDKVCRLD